MSIILPSRADRSWLTLHEIADLCGARVETVRYHHRKGALPARMLGRRLLVVEWADAKTYADAMWGRQIACAVVNPSVDVSSVGS